jgi:predicted GIY-YIG superfamily endonuclease
LSNRGKKAQPYRKKPKSPRRVTPTAGYVYLIKSVGTNHYKIGKTVNLDKRLPQLQTGSANRLEVHHFVLVSDMRNVEKSLHVRYVANRLRKNGEWFDFSTYEAREVVRTMNKIEQEYKILPTKTTGDSFWWGALIAAGIMSLFLYVSFQSQSQPQPQPAQYERVLPDS